MKLTTKIFTIISILFFLSCNSELTTKELNNNFSKEQIHDLNKIIEFYKNEISNSSSSDFKTLFNLQLKEFSEKGKNPKIYDLDYSKQKALYNTISKETFKSIWYFCEQYHSKTDISKRIICFDSKTKYKYFLADVGRYNKHIAEYAKIQNNLGLDTTTWLEQTILMYPKEFDLSDQNIQLIIAIHYLSQNDLNKRNEFLK
jgi:hypothetical protein